MAAATGTGPRADPAACGRATRPKPCKLAMSPVLRAWWRPSWPRRWSPQQIAGWLKLTYPEDPEMQVSHETIYLSLFVQSRGALRKELNACLRTGRAMRYPRGKRLPDGAGQMRDIVTSANDPPRSRTGPCPVTGKATWSSAAAQPGRHPGRAPQPVRDRCSQLPNGLTAERVAGADRSGPAAA